MRQTSLPKGFADCWLSEVLKNLEIFTFCSPVLFRNNYSLLAFKGTSIAASACLLSCKNWLHLLRNLFVWTKVTYLTFQNLRRSLANTLIVCYEAHTFQSECRVCVGCISHILHYTCQYISNTTKPYQILRIQKLA